MINKTILIIDDTLSNLDIVSDFLIDYDVIAINNGADAISIIHSEKIDLILLDIIMPDMDGYELCKLLKDDNSTEHIPIIFLTSKSDEDSIEMAYDIGGIDYVTKPFKPKELLAKVKRELYLQDLQEELKLLASTDPMTKLFNRRYFTEMSESLLDLAKREKTQSAIIMLDIDKFKNINDTYGHKVGDDVIISLSKTLQEFTRKSDVVSRWGGEEFVILLPNTDLDGALTIAEKIRVTVENLVLLVEENKDLKFTVSIGVSTVYSENDLNIEASINRADIALYTAKKSGRNKVCAKQIS